MLYDPKMKPMVNPTPVPIMAPILFYRIEVRYGKPSIHGLRLETERLFALTSLDRETWSAPRHNVSEHAVSHYSLFCQTVGPSIGWCGLAAMICAAGVDRSRKRHSRSVHSTLVHYIRIDACRPALNLNPPERARRAFSLSSTKLPRPRRRQRLRNSLL